MKKLLNSRPILLFAIAMCISLVFFIYHNIFEAKIGVLVCSIVISVVALVLFLVLKNKICKIVFSRILVVFMAIIVSLGAIKFDESMYSRDYLDYNGYATISARISEVGQERDGNLRTIILDNVHIKTDDFEKDMKYKTSLVVLLDGNEESTFVVGNNIVAYAKISFSTLYYVGKYGLTFYYRNKDISASGYVAESNISVQSGGNYTLSDKIKNKIESIAYEQLDEEYAGLAMGMLFGERSELDEDVYQVFSYTGISHLLAVSGLHVGFLVALLLLFCKLIKAKNWVRFLLISAVLVLYIYLCGFTVSVVRASIMAMCMLLATCFKQKYDSLNALAVAFIIIAGTNPFSITTVGFKLSFVAVLSIILLARPIADFLSKFLYKKFAQTIAVILSVQIGTTCILITSFSHITLVAVVANFVSIPVASLAYMVLVVTMLVAVVCPPIAINVYLFQFIMQVVVKFNHLIAAYGYMEIARWKGNALTALSLPLMYVSSNYLFLGKKLKYVIVPVLAIVYLIVLIC